MASESSQYFVELLIYTIHPFISGSIDGGLVVHTPTVVGVTVALLLGAEAVVAPANAVTTPTHVTTSSDFTSRVVATGLSDPWEITVGPDGYLWTTERSTGHVVRVNPKDGSVHEALVVDEVVSAAADVTSQTPC